MDGCFSATDPYRRQRQPQTRFLVFSVELSVPVSAVGVEAVVECGHPFGKGVQVYDEEHDIGAFDVQVWATATP